MKRMKKLLLLLLVSILVLGGFGTVAIPIEKLTEVQPLSIQYPPIEINVRGGLLGYIVTIKNVGNVTFSGKLSMTITTNAMIMIMGDVLSYDNFELDLEVGEYLKFKWGPIIGFGPARIYLESRFRLESGDEYYNSVKANGLILGPFVFFFYDYLCLHE
jgi:hypothetical protein